MDSNRDLSTHDDLSTLAWVQEELRKSLEAAHKAICRFVRETEGAAPSDIDAVDPAILRGARHQIHQSAGALELVGLNGAAMLLHAAEAAVQRFVLKPHKLDQAAAAVLEQGFFAVLDYVGRLLAGKRLSPVSLFSQYSAVQKLAGAERIHPADLWSFDWHWVELPAEPDVTPRAADTTARSEMERLLLTMMRQAAPVAPVAQRMSDLCAGLGAQAPTLQSRTFWRLSAAFFEGQALGLLPPDLHTKRVASRVLAQFGQLGRQESDVSDRLAQDLLFFCAQCSAADALSAPRLLAVRRAYGLEQAVAVNYAEARLGRLDPGVLQQARKRVAAAKESWSGVADGELHHLGLLQEQFGLAGDSLSRIYSGGDVLAKALEQAVAQAVRTQGSLDAGLAMEVATCMLYLEASLEEAGFDEPELAPRMAQLAARITCTLQGQTPGPLEPWMEDLYRRVSDRQTLDSVVQELRAWLQEAEGHLDQFFRQPENFPVLASVPAQLSAMRGVLSVLGLRHASQAVARMHGDIEALLAAGAQQPTAQREEAGQRLACNLSTLGFLVDMVAVQPNLARSLFVFDEQAGELRSLMGRACGNPAASGPAAEALTAQPGIRAVHPGEAGEAVLPGKETVHPVPTAAAKEPNSASAPTEREISAGMRTVSPDTAAPAAGGVVDEYVDPEMREIFLEEAAEVMAQAHRGLDQLAESPAAMEPLTVLRRAFHTLKGSSRMVGLKEFGEASWACEQLYNLWLAEQRPASADLLSVSHEALGYLSAWIQEIAAGIPSTHLAQPVHQMADALRLEGRLLTLACALAVDGEPQRGDALAVPKSAVPQDEEAESTGPGQAQSFLPDAPALHEEEGPAAIEAAVQVAPEELQTLDAAEDAALHAALQAALLDPSFGEVQHDAAARTEAPSGTEVQSQARDTGAGADRPELEALPAATALPVELSVADFELLFGKGDGEPARQESAPEETPPVAAESLPVLTALEDVAPPVAWPEVQVQEVDLEIPAPETGSPQADGLALDIEAGFLPVPETAEQGDGEARVQDPDPVKVIGSLQVPLPLFEIYLAEAEQLSQRLCSELSQADILSRLQLSELALASAHSLAGCSATVGFAELSQLARQLEHALAHTRTLGVCEPQSAQLFDEVAQEIRHLLHQFAAGVLCRPRPHLLERLVAQETEAARSLRESPPGLPHELLEADVLALETEILAEDRELAATGGMLLQGVQDLSVEARGGGGQPEGIDLGRETHPGSGHPDAGTRPSEQVLPGAPGHLLAPQVPAAPLPGKGSRVQDIDDDIDVQDAVDADLFPIFEEEAVELLPKLSGELREWLRHPGEAVAAHACMRTLHTLKGSARLAGALRLGELAHRLETSIERLISGGPISGVDVEPLQGKVDELSATFEALRFRDAQAYSEAAARLLAAVEAPAEAPPKPAAEPAARGTASPGAEPPSVVRAEDIAVQPLPAIDWSRFTRGAGLQRGMGGTGVQTSVRVRAQLLDRLVNEAGEVSIARARLEAEIGFIRNSTGDLADNLERLRQHLRDIELQAETRMAASLQEAKAEDYPFDPLEFDRFTRFQELTRMMAESVNDVQTVQRTLLRSLQAAEDELAIQARLTRELQGTLLRTRMVEFETLSERFYRVVRQAAKESGKQVRLDIAGGATEVDRGVLERMTASFEHLLRNAVTHGIESPEQRAAAGKDPTGTILVSLQHEGNEVMVEFRDDGVGLNLPRIRERAIASGKIPAEARLSDEEIAELIFLPGLTTAETVTELAGRGVGMDVVRADVNAMGGRIETSTTFGKGMCIRLVLPLTTAVTQVVILRCGKTTVGVPANLIEIVLRGSVEGVARAHQSGVYALGEHSVPFFWLGALLQTSAHSQEPPVRSVPVVIARSASQRVALQVDEVLGHQEVVVKNLGPQLSHLPGLAGMALLASGAVGLIYNPVALATVYGQQARALALSSVPFSGAAPASAAAAETELIVPLVLVVDDSLTVRRVTQRLLLREGYRVALAKDGLDALERLAEERPAVVLSDIEMPRMDGFDLVRNLRADTATAGLPIIMITSRIAQKHRDYAAELRVDHYLGKPYSEDELLGLIAQYCRTPEPV